MGFLEYVKLIGWILLAFWSWYMTGRNNQMALLRRGEEKSLYLWSVVMWFVVMVYSIVRCARMF